MEQRRLFKMSIFNTFKNIFNIFRNQEGTKLIGTKYYNIKIQHNLDKHYFDDRKDLIINYDKEKDRNEDFDKLNKAIKSNKKYCELKNITLNIIKNIQIIKKEDCVDWVIKDKKNHS